MKHVINQHYRLIVVASSLVGLLYGLGMMVGRLNVAFGAVTRPDDQQAELANLLFDVPHLIPGLLGLIFFWKRPARIMVTVLFLLYAVVTLLTTLAITLADSALAAGLPYVVIGLPIVLIITLLLVTFLFTSKTKKL